MNYPFTAIVGQEKLKKALLLCAINPDIGGLLIQGDKGTAKSTAARALAEVVPQITKVVNCSFNCSETPAAVCDMCKQSDKERVQVQVPFINLPLGATEERILGSLDLEGVLVEKKKKFQPGLLAAVNRGILYIDEVNLLSDHLVDVLLDASAMGENIIEREGLSLSHPARFTLIGTMNPEEGKLRPQFLDRFGLMVEVEAPEDLAERIEVVRRRIAFEVNPAAFASEWETLQKKLQNSLIKARDLLPSVQLNDELLTLISQLAIDLKVKSLRADIVIYKTAVTLAALNHRTTATSEDIFEATELALAHRTKKQSFAETKSSEENAGNKKQKAPAQNNGAKQESSKQNSSSIANGNSSNNSDLKKETDKLLNEESQSQADQEQIFKPILPLFAPPLKVDTILSKQAEQNGRRSLTKNAKRGLYSSPEPTKNTTDIALDATVVHAVMRNPDQLNVTIDDLHGKKRNGKTGNLILFVVDASGSMAANKRMEAVKGSVISLLTDAYQKRDTVGVIAFRGIEAQVLLDPTQSVDLAEDAMRSLPTGGRTPLPHALETAIQLLHRFGQMENYKAILVILTDGKANVALPGGGDPWRQTLTLANQIKNLNIQSIVLNSELNYFNLNRAEELANSLGGQYLSLNDISKEQLTPIINQLL